MFTPEFWILISFVCFIAFLGRKIYSKVVAQLDSYISEVSGEIEEAEKIKEEAAEMLKSAYLRRDEQSTEVEQYKVESEQKLNRLAEANKKYIDSLAAGFQQSFEKNIQAVISKRVDGITNDIISKVINQLESEILQKKPKIRVSAKDLKKL